MFGTRLFQVFVQTRVTKDTPFLFVGNDKGVSVTPIDELVADSATEARDRFLCANPKIQASVLVGLSRVVCQEIQVPAFPG